MEYLLIPNNKNIELFSKYDFDAFILPLEGYSIGFENYFSINEINEASSKYKVYVMINKFLHKNEIKEIKKVLNELKNIKAFFVEDLSLINLIDKERIILFQNHIINNYEGINFLYNEGIKNVVVSNELTHEELKEISEKTQSKLYYFYINKNMLMYSKRTLVSNYLNHYGYMDEVKSMNVFERVSRHELFVKEENDSTSIFEGKIFVGSNKYVHALIVNINNMNDIEVSEILNNYRGEVKLENCDNYFLNNKVSYKVKL